MTLLLYTDIDLSGVERVVAVEFAVVDLAEGFDVLGQGIGGRRVLLVLDAAIPPPGYWIVVGVVVLVREDVDAIRLLLAAPSLGVERVDVDEADADRMTLHRFKDLGS